MQPQSTPPFDFLTRLLLPADATAQIPANSTAAFLVKIHRVLESIADKKAAAGSAPDEQSLGKRALGPSSAAAKQALTNMGSKASASAVNPKAERKVAKLEQPGPSAKRHKRGS